MSLLLLGGLTSIGKYLNKNKKQPREQTNLRNELSTREIPNGRNVYHSNRSQQVRRDVQHQANDLYKRSQHPEKTGIVPPFWADEKMAKPRTIKNQQRPEKDPYNIIDPNEYKTLYADKVDNPYFNNAYQVKKPFALDQTLPQRCENVKENFTHQNMVPFFKGSGSVNTIDHDERDLEHFTGQNVDRIEKRELQGLLFEPSKENPYAQPGLNIGLEDRYITSIYRKNEKPFEQTYVSKPNIYTDGNYRLHEKNVDELRARSNPKVTFAWDATPGKNYVTKSGKVAKFVKYKPNRYRTQDMGDLIVTTGSVIRPQIPEQFRPVHTYRHKQNIRYKGSLGPASRQEISNKHNTQYEQAISLKQTGMYATGDTGSHGVQQMNGLTVYDPDDVQKRTLKEHHMYQTGDNNVHGVSKQNAMTSYDPNDVQKRTLKEHHMYQTGDNNVHGAREQNAMTAYDPNDVQRRTLKENHMYQTGDNNVHGVSKQNAMTSYDPNDVQRRTLKEDHMYQTGDNNIHGVTEQFKMPAYDPDDVQRRTLKEDHIYQTGDQGTRGTNRQDRLTVYDPDDVQRRTLKEDHIYQTGDTGMVSANDQKGLGHAISNTVAYPTLKQITTNHQYSSHGLSNNPRRRTYQAEENLNIKGLKGVTNVYRTPTQNGDKKPLGVENYHIKTPKESIRWNKRIEKNKVYDTIKRVVPHQRLKRDDVATATRFAPELFDLENQYTQPISRPVLNTGTELYQMKET